MSAIVGYSDKKKAPNYSFKLFRPMAFFHPIWLPPFFKCFFFLHCIALRSLSLKADLDADGIAAGKKWAGQVRVREMTSQRSASHVVCTTIVRTRERS